MRRGPSASINRSSIEWATDHARQTVRHFITHAKKFSEDPDREKRLKTSECVVCYGGSRIGGSACTSRPCPLCGVQLSSGNTNIALLCLDCALANGLCKHCGADLELKNRRKPRPYETWPPPPKCVNPECQQPVRGEYCCSCGMSQMDPASL